jgi:putative membrane protein
MFSGSFVELWNPVALLVLIVVAYVYLRAAKMHTGSRVSASKKASFLFGLVLFYIADGSPLNYVGHHYFFSVHMLDQSILYLIMPLFVLFGMPGWMVERPLRALRLDRTVKLLVNPLIAIFTFNLLFSMYHIPMVMDRVMTNDWLRFGYQAALIVSAFMMWFPIAGRAESWTRMSELKRMAYIFMNGILLTPACALIIFAGKPLYEMYQGVTMPIIGYSVVEDQQLGGVVMKILQEVTYGTALAITFYRWFNNERKREEAGELEEPQGSEFGTPLSGGLNRA